MTYRLHSRGMTSYDTLGQHSVLSPADDSASCAGRHGMPGYLQGGYQVPAPYTAVMSPQRPVSMAQGQDLNPVQAYGNAYAMQHPGRPMSGGDGARYPAAYAQRYQ